MLMHVITNFMANAGAEAMLARLLRDRLADDIVVPLIDVSDRYRASSPSIRYRPLKVRSAGGMLCAVPRLAKIIRTEKPDAILCWMYHAMAVGTAARWISGTNAPLYWNVRQSLDDPAALTRSTRIALRASRALSRLPDGIIFNAARAARLHEQFGFANANITVIPNGFEPVEVETSPSNRPKVFGIAARFHPQKDHRTFFAAAALLAKHHPEARFVAAGAGMDENNSALSQLIAESGLPAGALVLRGELEDMKSFYEGIDVLVLSSRTEGFPNVVGEAMSYGRPVVTTDVGDAAAIVGDTGIVVAPGQPEALATAMERMLSLSSQEYAQLAAAARHRVVQHYGLKSVIGQYESFVGKREPGPVVSQPTNAPAATLLSWPK